MEKLQRNERLAAMLKMLCDKPGKVFNLGCFSELLGSAKSSLSEDIDIIRGSLEKFGLGTIETIPGASGGVKYLPLPGKEMVGTLLKTLVFEFQKKERILPGGYLYMLDIIYNPQLVSDIGLIFAGHFHKMEIDYVITMETKGIPLAFMTAKYLNTPLLIVRHHNEAADGASVNINYISGSSRMIQTMVLPMRSLKRNSKLLFIDDFMKGGGTAKGILELAREFECEVTGIGVLIETRDPEKKLVDKHFSIFTLNGVDEEKKIINIIPSSDEIFYNQYL